MRLGRKQDESNFVLVPTYDITSIDTDDSGFSTSRKGIPWEHLPWSLFAKVFRLRDSKFPLK
jgi:hypothetical protein